MKVETHRFGTLDVDEEDLISCPEGLIGLSRLNRFVLIQDPNSPDLFWFQCADDPIFALALVHADKLDWPIPIDWSSIDIGVLRESQPELLEVFYVLNRVEGEITANLMGPILINGSLSLGKQVVLSDPRFDVRHPLQVQRESAACSV